MNKAELRPFRVLASEAIHGAASEYAEQWIASPQALLAMTEDNKPKGARQERL
jgi:hypothetical protein